MKKENQDSLADCNPTMDEIINELTVLNSKLTFENISLKISLNKLANKILSQEEDAADL